jgi:hypothetical protein
MQEENTAPPNSLRQWKVLQMVSFFSSLRTTLAIALLCLPHSAMAQSSYFAPLQGEAAHTYPSGGPWRPANINPQTGRAYDTAAPDYRAGAPKYGNAKRKPR